MRIYDPMCALIGAQIYTFFHVNSLCNDNVSPRQVYNVHTAAKRLQNLQCGQFVIQLKRACLIVHAHIAAREWPPAWLAAAPP